MRSRSGWVPTTKGGPSIYYHMLNPAKSGRRPGRRRRKQSSSCRRNASGSRSGAKEEGVCDGGEDGVLLTTVNMQQTDSFPYSYGNPLGQFHRVGLHSMWGNTMPWGGGGSEWDDPKSFFQDILPRIPAKHRPLECTLRAGETIFLPSGWWHLVLNTQATVAVTENMMNAGNAGEVLREMAKRKGLRGAVDGCVEELRRSWPHLEGL